MKVSSLLYSVVILACLGCASTNRTPQNSDGSNGHEYSECWIKKSPEDVSVFRNDAYNTRVRFSLVGMVKNLKAPLTIKQDAFTYGNDNVAKYERKSAKILKDFMSEADEQCDSLRPGISDETLL